MATVETVNNALWNTYNAIVPDGVGCIVYVFDNSDSGMGCGFNSNECDAGDAMVAIKRIANEFGIDLNGLAASME